MSILILQFLQPGCHKLPMPCNIFHRTKLFWVCFWTALLTVNVPKHLMTRNSRILVQQHGNCEDILRLAVQEASNPRQYSQHCGQSVEKNTMVYCQSVTCWEDKAMWYLHGQSLWGHQRWSVGQQMFGDSSGRHDLWVTQVKGRSESWTDTLSLYRQSQVPSTLIMHVEVRSLLITAADSEPQQDDGN